jgi:ABC-type transport system involved in multi-copper enzyme maturation permease subunit
MRPVFLIATNFVRTQWILLTLMLLYIVGIAGVFGWHSQRDEVLFFLRQQAYYALFLGSLLGIPAIQNERKTRRILAVLSKGIHRWQYIAGMLLGSGLIAGAYCLAVGLATVWLCAKVSASTEGLPALMLVLFLCCIAAAAVGLFWSVMMHPVLALTATGLTLVLPLLLPAKSLFGALFPVLALARGVLQFDFGDNPGAFWKIGAAAVVQTVIFFIGASAIFAHKDVTIAPE